MSNQKNIAILLIAGLIKRPYKVNEYFFSRSRRFRRDIKFKLHLSNYAAKTDLKNATHVDVSSFASKTNLASLKTEVNKLDVENLKT